MDTAFQRRFQSMIYFPLPDASLRLKIWKKIFSGKLRLAPSVDLLAVAEKYELSGGEIVNVLQSAAIKVAERGGQEVILPDLIAGIRKEFQKNGRVV